MKLNRALRWFLAVLGAAAAFVLTFLIGRFVFFALFGAVQSAADLRLAAAAAGLTIMCSLIAWTWAGLFLAPIRYGRAALVVFSAPIVVLAVASAYELTWYEHPPSRVAFGVGTLLAFVAVVILGIVSRPWARAAARRQSVDEIADVFSDRPTQKAHAQE